MKRLVYHRNLVLRNLTISILFLLYSLGSNADELFPFEDLLNEMKKNGRFGIVMGMMLLPLLTSVADDIPDLDALSEQMNSGEKLDENLFKFEKTDAVYKRKMRDIIVDMDKLGYI